MEKNHSFYIKKTVELAEKAAKHGDFPVGSIIVKDNKIISKAYNQKEKKKIATKHAEIIAIEKACKKLKTWHLEDCILYTSMEPCLMCLGAIKQCRIKTVIYSTHNECFGAVENNIIKNNFEIIKIENKEYISMIKTFFKDKRK